MRCGFGEMAPGVAKRPLREAEHGAQPVEPAATRPSVQWPNAATKEPH